MIARLKNTRSEEEFLQLLSVSVHPLLAEALRLPPGATPSEITAKIEAFLKQDAWRCYTLSTDSCSICDKCTYPKKSCNHPDLMHPCIESHGILLTKNIEDNHMDYYMGEQMVLWFSLIFLREA